jgi:4-oxalocrotonate tautomerase
MALVRIDFCNTQAHDFGANVASVINRVMAQVLNVPESENYLVSQAHHLNQLLHNPANVLPERLAEIVFIQITLNTGRSAELKSTFYAELTKALCTATTLKSENVFINLVEVAKDNWSFGRPSIT